MELYNPKLKIKNDNINPRDEKLNAYNIIRNATDEDLLSACSSHIKTTSIINSVKHHDAIGAFYIGISNLQELKQVLINPILETGTFLKGIYVNKYQDDSYKLEVKTIRLPAIRNAIHGNLADEAKELHRLVWYYTKKEYSLFSLGRSHVGSENVTHKHRRIMYLDISNLITVIKFLKNNRLYECLNLALKFSRNLLDKAMSEDIDSPSDCDNTITAIAINTNRFISDQPKIVSIFPYFSNIPNFIKLKCLISHHQQLAEIISPNNYLQH